MKKHMSKEEIQKIQASAKKRKNRRLKDGEAARLMAQASSVLGFNENSKRFEGIEDNIGHLTDNFGRLTRTPALLPQRKTQKMKNALKILSNNGLNIDRFKSKKTNKNRRLNNKQFEALMELAATALGINDDDSCPILDLNSDTKYGTKELVDLILANFDYSETYRGLRKKYEEIIKTKKFTNKDELSVLAYLYYHHDRGLSKYPPKPMCLLSRKGKTNKVRKIVKYHMDVKDRIERIIPDDEYFKEVTGKARETRDAFDYLKDDVKIEWARQANNILGFTDFENMHRRNFEALRMIGNSNIILAMKYACKMCNMPEFKGIFLAPYWIMHRIGEYCSRITGKEFDVFYKLALEHLGVTDKTIPIISEKKAIEKMIPTLRKMRLLQKYRKALKNKLVTQDSGLSLQVIKEIIFNHG